MIVSSALILHFVLSRTRCTNLDPGRAGSAPLGRPTRNSDLPVQATEASQIASSLADILLRDRTTPLGLPVEPDVKVIMAAPSSNGRFGGKVSEILIGEGVQRFS